MNGSPDGPGGQAQDDESKETGAATPPRKPRADAERNRERLLEVAKAAFAETGTDISLDEIARRAGVGIGTFYRHFPTRGAIVAAVYRREVRQLADAAARLAANMAPADALQAWMRLFVDYIATKKVIAPALGAEAGGVSAIYAESGVRLEDEMAMLVQGAIAGGQIRADADPNDLLRALIGITYGNTSAGWEASAHRLIDILMAGLRAQPVRQP